MTHRVLIISITLFLNLAAVSCVPPPHLRHNRHFYKSNNHIVRTAERYIGVKYKNGGHSPRGFDCSGLVMFTYKKNGINIPRSVSAQYYFGRKIPLRAAKPGDLVFFKINKNRVSHVGIYTGNHEFIHAPRTGKRVSRAKIDNPYWKKRFISAVQIRPR